MISSNSKENKSTARPLSLSATKRLWMYSMAPTSSPLVGYATTNKDGDFSISRAIIAFC